MADNSLKLAHLPVEIQGFELFYPRSSFNSLRSLKFLNQLGIVISDIDLNALGQVFSLFRRAPGPSG